MSHKMFRYLEHNYTGKYRVLAPYDESTEDFPRDEQGGVADSFDDQYIPCKRGVIKASYDSPRGRDILYLYFESPQQGKNVYKDIIHTYPDIWIETEEIGSDDYMIYFEAEDIDKIAAIVTPRTNGSKIKPYSIKNLPKVPYVIPEEDSDRLQELTKNLSQEVKMHFLRETYADFDEVITKKKGKRYKIKLERTKSKLKNKEFIHSIGMWDDFIEFVKEKKGQIKEEK